MVDSFRWLRWRLTALQRSPWVLVVLLVGDVVELAASLALAAVSAPPARPHLPYASLDVPNPPPVPTYGVAFLGIALGLLMGASLVGELWWMVRRMMIERRRYAARRTPGTARPAHGPSGTAT